MSSITVNRLALLYCHHIPDRRPVYPYIDLFTGSCRESQDFNTGSMTNQAFCKKRLRNPSVVYCTQTHTS